VAPELRASGNLPGLIDSHCHLDFPEFNGKIGAVREEMQAHGVTHALCISVGLRDLPNVLNLAETHANFFATVGIHPDHDSGEAASEVELAELAKHPKVVAIGETGLDYHRVSGDLEWQRQRFRAHIRAARRCGKPLVIHTREAADDTLRILREEGAAEVGGVFHCFTESQGTAEQAIEMGFHISFSGIVTFKNAQALKEIARQVPLERMLVETDAPYLAPVPFRGKVNQPAWVRYVAEEIARLRGVAIEPIAEATSRNFAKLFLGRAGI